MIKAGIIGATGYAGTRSYVFFLDIKMWNCVVWFKKLYRSEICRYLSELCFSWWMPNVWMIIWKHWQMRWM